MSIAEVAKAAGVSTATVSRVLNDFPGVRIETVQQVRAAVAALRYTPLRVRKPHPGTGSNGLSRSSLKTGNIAVITVGHDSGWLQLPVMASVVSGIQRAAAELGQRLILEELRDVTKPAALIAGKKIDGAVVFLGSGRPLASYAEALRVLKSSVPIVWAMGMETTSSGIDHVSSNNVGIGQIAYDYLAGQGCTRLAYFTSEPSWLFMRLRGQAFLNAALDDGQVATAYVVTNNPLLAQSFGVSVRAAPTFEACVESMVQGPERPDGVFVANDAMVARLYPILGRLGIKPGRDIKIISCDNETVRLSALEPRPVTIDIGAEEIGYRAAMRLKGRWQHPDHPPLLIQVAPRLVLPD